MTDSGKGFGLSAPANERTDRRLHSRADLVRRSALLWGAVLATGEFITALARSGAASTSGRDERILNYVLRREHLKEALYREAAERENSIRSPRCSLVKSRRMWPSSRNPQTSSRGGEELRLRRRDGRLRQLRRRRRESSRRRGRRSRIAQRDALPARSADLSGRRRRWDAVVADATRRVLRQEQADRFREPHVWTGRWHQRALGGADRLARGRVRRDPRNGPAGSSPGRVSHGCIRMRNGDILRLSRLMPVGTPITIR
jgi:hypothetical protein